MTLQQREVLCAEVCQQAMRDWRAGKIGNQELIWITWQAQQRYGVGEVFGSDGIHGVSAIEAADSPLIRAKGIGRGDTPEAI